jgi:4-amino-4-deoxy-L-arabinose transferase-like glycosyltransferase
MSRSAWLGTCLAWALFCAAGAYVAATESATYDEVPHIAAGVRYLAGDLSLNREHPPLVKALAAAALPDRDPALPMPASADLDAVQWTWGSEWLHEANQPPLDLLLRARLPIVLLSSVLLFVVALWAQRLAGSRAACVAAGLLATCPTWLAHSALVTTDSAATLFFFCACYAGYRLVRGAREERWRCAAALAAVLALGLATKYSMLAALGLVPLGIALDALALRRPGALLPAAVASGAGALLGILFAWGLPPQPWIYFAGVSHVGDFHVRGHMFYAFGEVFHERDPLYFARALAVKVSIPVLLLCALSPWLVRRGPLDPLGAPGERRFSWLLLIPPLGYYLLMAGYAPAIGVRYVLPVVPFLCLLAGVAAAGLWRRARWRWLLAPLAAAQLLGFASALRATPLAFFNGLGCRTGDALPCLDDSNVDWGQALPQLKRFRDQRFPGETIRIFYYGSSPPRAYIDHLGLADASELSDPLPAVYAMSLHLRARSPKAAWPRQRQPNEVVGGAYAIFDLRGEPRKAP